MRPLFALCLSSFLTILVATCSTPRNGRYIFPKSYVAPVIILFGIPSARPLAIEDGFYVYRIPASGVLKTSTGAGYAIDDQIFYAEDESGERTQIEYVYADSQREGVGKGGKTFSDISPGGNAKYVTGAEMGYFNVSGRIFRYRAFHVGHAFDGDAQERQLRKKLGELQKELSAGNE